MGGRGAASGKGGKSAVNKETRSILRTKTSNILGGKEGSEKQRSYAESLVERYKNTLTKHIKERSANQVWYQNKLKEASTKSGAIQRIAKKAAESTYKKMQSENRQLIKRYSSALKKAKNKKTLGEVINVLS